MNFNESIALNEYSNNANVQFDEMQNRLSDVEGSFQNRMNGKTKGRIICSIIGNFLWLALFIVGAILVNEIVSEILLTITMAIVFCLILFMIIDNIINLSYYGKINTYINLVAKLKSRVDIGKNAIKSNHDAFWESKTKGWNYYLKAGASIPEETILIESTMSNMESLKSGFVNGAKNIFYYATTIVITITGCVALFPVGKDIMTGIGPESLSDDLTLVLNIVALVIIGIVEVILSKLVWSKTNCTVTNTTLFIMAFGPVAFLALILLATLIVLLVVGLVTIIGYIIGVIVVCAILFASVSGG